MDTKNFDALILSLYQQFPHIVGKFHASSNKHPEQLINQIVNYYNDIINCMPGNVYWLDTQGVAVGCNKNVLEMFGLSSLDEFKGLSFEDMGRIGAWTEEATASFKEDTLNVVRTGKAKLNIEEPPIPHHDGRVIHFLTSRVPLFDQDSHVIGVVGISIDITDLKNAKTALQIAKEEAETANLSKSDFIANMSHDIKTPLAGMIGTAELLAYRLNDDDQELALNIKLCGEQLLNLFENCLEVFKLESNNMNLPEQSFHLKQEIDAILNIFNHAVNTKKLTINTNISHNIPEYVYGSRAGLQRILINLIGNAIKFTNKGQITISVSAEKTPFSNYLITFDISDTGIGIPKDKQKIIFERFTRLIPSYKGTYEGSGIGLYVVTQIIKAMQGNISLVSKLHKGSQFTIELPFKAASNIENISVKNDIHPHNLISHDTPSFFKKNTMEPQENNLYRILMVEDNLAVQRMQSALLSSLNCFVEIANSGEEALDLFEVGKYDLILMDLGLPNIQGDLTARLMRKIEHGFALSAPIVALTAHVDEETQVLCQQSGINESFNKPVSLDQVKKILEKYCEMKN